MANRILNPTAVVISDLHVGDPCSPGLEDFNRDDDFARLLSEIIPRRAGWPATLIIAGDFIDFAQVLPELGRHEEGDRFGSTEEESLRKFQRVVTGHPMVFAAIREYLEKGGQVLVLPGNHDIDLHWPLVWSAFREAVGGAGAPELDFVKEGEIKEQGIYIEHGNQYSYDNWFEFWTDPILQAEDKQRLERPWGTLFLDLVYNDIEELYPFVNQVYPHAKLAWLALRSFIEDERVSARSLARLVAFFMTKGDRFLIGRMLGAKERSRMQAKNASEAVDLFLKEMPIQSEERRVAIAAETVSLLPADAFPEPSNEKLKVDGLLGSTDEWGMGLRQRELLISGKATIVVFGHTHEPVDGNIRPLWGVDDPRRIFNTGSWMPVIPIGRNESPSWRELRSRGHRHDVRFLMLELAEPPTGRLEPLLPPDSHRRR